jgi:hypothetical protein
MKKEKGDEIRGQRERAKKERKTIRRVERNKNGEERID